MLYLHRWRLRDCGFCVCAVVFGPTDPKQTGETFLHVASPPAGWRAVLGWLCCIRALFVVWRAMHYGTVHLYSAHTETHTELANFLDRKFRPYTTTKDTALSCLQSEVKRVLFRCPWVCVCVCARVSPALAQTADICRPGCSGWVKM